MADKPKSPAEWLEQNPVPETPPDDSVVYWDFTPGKPVEAIDHKLSDMIRTAAPATAAERALLERQHNLARLGRAQFTMLQKQHEQRGDPLVMYGHVVYWLVNKDPSLAAERLTGLLVSSVPLGGLRGGRDLINPLTSAPPEEPDLRNNTAIMAAPRSVWAAWLTLQGLPVPEGWAPPLDNDDKAQEPGEPDDQLAGDKGKRQRQKAKEYLRNKGWHQGDPITKGMPAESGVGRSTLQRAGAADEFKNEPTRSTHKPTPR
jgi:hypothetical protein